jgi:hypothetical protein
MWHLAGPAVRPLTAWAEHSQRTACRNAMVASTQLLERRREREETQEFIDGLLAHRSRRAGAAPTPLPAARLG